LEGFVTFAVVRCEKWIVVHVHVRHARVKHRGNGKWVLESIAEELLLLFQSRILLHGGKHSVEFRPTELLLACHFFEELRTCNIIELKGKVRQRETNQNEAWWMRGEGKKNGGKKKIEEMKKKKKNVQRRK
jgi:hypothetical protein